MVLNNPSDFLTTAAAIMKFASSEADFRSVVNRSYYAAFLTVREKTKTIVNYSGEGDHYKAREHLRTKKYTRQQFNDFMSMWKARKNADYILTTTVVWSDADDNLKLSTHFIQNF